ncbi:hypothetical protein pphageT12_25 [Pseudomonas phage pphageT12]|nr:hypothetical protein pphageB21_25 [Pseudomonas phage pphageB21]UAW53717.1 hypothetical protein pphageT21_25 [Pseudomonas phage pphageT21]UAW53776.1 hypothetical protein pphageT12_25 [Pseudomonas phage pphageT12]UAW53836.1 hypothetical protein pphageBV72_24 [Pseudomonas phage pphageBV72]
MEVLKPCELRGHPDRAILNQSNQSAFGGACGH